MEDTSRFFIIGCQRSGTNLIRLILDAHPNTWVFGEPTSHWLLDNNKLDDVNEAARWWTSEISEIHKPKIMKQFEEIIKYKSLNYFGYTTPGWTELFLEYKCIKEKLQNIPKIICMIRDPFDVISSIISLKQFSLSTIDTMQLWLTDENRVFKKRYSHLLHKNDDLWKLRWFSVYWNYKTQACLDIIQDKYYNAIGVRYEDLCTNPEKTISQICNFLEIPWHDDLLSHSKKEHFETIENFTNGRTRTDLDIFKSSIKKNKLSEVEREVVLSVNEILILRIEETYKTHIQPKNISQMSVYGINKPVPALDNN